MSKYDRDIQDVYAVKQLGDAIGYGHLMAIAHELWARHLESKGLPRRGAHCVVGYPMVKEQFQAEALNDKIYTIIVGKALEAGRKTENSSEKPNNCEHITEDGVTCAKYPACDGCLDNPLNKVKGSERLVKGSEQTESTISKMEQVEVEPQTDDLQDWKDRMWAEAIVTETTTEDCSRVEPKMTLDEAIRHCEDVAGDRCGCAEDCVEEHRQLAEWLKELRERRAKDEPQTE